MTFTRSFLVLNRLKSLDNLCLFPNLWWPLSCSETLQYYHTFINYTLYNVGAVYCWKLPNFTRSYIETYWWAGFLYTTLPKQNYIYVHRRYLQWKGSTIQVSLYTLAGRTLCSVPEDGRVVIIVVTSFQRECFVFYSFICIIDWKVSWEN